MSLKENNSQNALRVKPEPLEYHIAPLGTSTTWQADRQHSANKSPFVKPEPVEPSAASNHAQTASHAEDVQMHDAEVKEPPAEPVAPLYTTYASVEAIDYTPENALKEGLGMVQTIKNNLRKLELGSKMRKDVWLREVTGLESQGAPTTLIAVCGATGAGKSSLLNAILDDNIVPTSGMRACTAVVTEIAYHDKPTINADVSFLALDEWKEELAVLLEDLIDEDGNVKRATDLRSEAGVAWHKVHAVYPSISADQIARMTPEQIIARDPIIAKRLGTTKLICSKDSKAFAAEISKFIDSKDQKRNKKDKKTKEKKVVKMADRAKGKDKDKKKKKDDKAADDDGPALWPLIRQVVVKCNSAALSTGAILVDLPGVADANAARSNIAKDYMKKCQAIWVLAPITRAVDDRTAKDLLGDAFKIQLKMDGNYDDSAITFVATKADDISCSEVIRALKLEDDEEIEAIEDKISEIKDDQKKWKTSKATAEKAAKATEKELKEIRAIAAEYREHLKALENGESFTPKLTAKKAKATSPSVESPNPKKRKRAGTGRKGSPKRQKSTDDGDTSQDDEEEDDDDEEEDEDEIESASDVDSDSGSSDSYADSDSGDEAAGSDAEENDSEAEVDEEMDAEDEVTEESLKAKIAETGETIKTLRERLSNERADKKKANDEMTNAKDRLAKAQTEKNGICSLKRSEFSREVLKDDFRTGLKEIDEADAQERDPDNFDPTQQLRNYDAIDLPTFCASARDYIRITKQVKGDGKPTCFTDIKDTGIPELQEWCRTLTISSRQRAARSFLTHLRTFVSSVHNYVHGITEVREEDRKALREQWESVLEEEVDSSEDESEDAFDPFSWMNEEAFEQGPDGIIRPKKKTQTSKVDIMGEPIGVTPRLTKEFTKIVDLSVEDLKHNFKDGLNEKLQVGAANAAASAVATSDEFAASMHWGTYRATLRRHGEFRRCLNTELINPLTKNIASSWAKIFEADLFASLEARAIRHIIKLIQDVENSSAAGLKDRARQQGDVALEEAKVAIKSLVTVVRKILNDQQKDISRCLVPHVQSQLRLGYDGAMEERGRGSVARQKAVFHNFIKAERDEVFNGGAETLIERLSAAAESIGAALDDALVDLSQKVEVSLSVLWESPRDDPRQIKARREAVDVLKIVDEQVSLWTDAERKARA